MKLGACVAMIVAVTRPKRNGTNVAICAANTAPITRWRGVDCGMYRAQSPSVEANETGLLSATSIAPMNAAQNPALP